jgi:hypothetical protein
VSVPKFLEDFRVLTAFEPERNEGVPEVIESYIWQARTPEERLEVAPAQVIAAHRGSDARSEDQIVILPNTSEAHPFLKLTLAMGAQGAHYRG